jgi:uncharacterized membrane protein
MSVDQSLKMVISLGVVQPTAPFDASKMAENKTEDKKTTTL